MSEVFRPIRLMEVRRSRARLRNALRVSPSVSFTLCHCSQHLERRSLQPPFQTRPSLDHRFVKLSLEEMPRRKIRQIRRHTDAAFV